MEIIKRNTDYALRALLNLAGHFDRDKAVSARQLAEQEDISYQFVCKIMQKLQKGGFVKSCMGSVGGFRLAKDPSQLNLLNIIASVQGPVKLNKCLADKKACRRRSKCPVNKKLCQLQTHIDSLLKDITLDKLKGSE